MNKIQLKSFWNDLKTGPISTIVLVSFWLGAKEKNEQNSSEIILEWPNMWTYQIFVLRMRVAFIMFYRMNITKKLPIKQEHTRNWWNYESKTGYCILKKNHNSWFNDRVFLFKVWRRIIVA